MRVESINERRWQAKLNRTLPLLEPINLKTSSPANIDA